MTPGSPYVVAVLGATGLVGRTILAVLEERGFPVARLVPLASERSAGSTVRFRGEEIVVGCAAPEAFHGVDIVLSSAGATASREHLPHAVEHGAVAIDNTSAYRMDEDVPLVVPEVNPHRVADYRRRGIIANPNCSTIQLVVALKPLHDAFGVERVIVATYQSVSGAGARAVDELHGESRRVLAGAGEGEGAAYAGTVFPKPIAFNALPQVDVFLPGGDTREEWKMRVETPKILEAPIDLHATCVRVPVTAGHSEAVWIETARVIDPEAAREVLRRAPGIEVIDDPAALAYPTARDLAGRDTVAVGRIRRDPTRPNGLAFWVVADNLRKGAATNAVQIAEELVALWEE